MSDLFWDFENTTKKTILERY